MKNWFKDWNNYNRAVRELRSLDNRTLEDIGISRGDIRAVALGKHPLHNN